MQNASFVMQYVGNASMGWGVKMKNKSIFIIILKVMAPMLDEIINL